MNKPIQPAIDPKIEAEHGVGTADVVAEASGGIFESVSSFYNIYRGQNGVMDYNHVVATMLLTDTQVSIPGQILAANSSWTFIRRLVAANGLESIDSSPCYINIDSSGNLILDTPNTVHDLSLKLLAAGQFQLRWRYTPLSDGLIPDGFNIYIDSGSGFNFSVPAAVVTAGSLNFGDYIYISNSYSNGQLVKFTVRSFITAGAETKNTDYVSGTADSVGPAAITTGVTGSFSII